MISPERYRVDGTQSNKARAVFLEAIEQPAPEMRADFLDVACGADVELMALAAADF